VVGGKKGNTLARALTGYELAQTEQLQKETKERKVKERALAMEKE